MNREPRSYISVRLPTEMKDRLEALLPEFERKYGGATLSALIRYILYRELCEMELDSDRIR